MNIAVLDLGSTTFHLESFRAFADGTVASVLDAKRTLCLGDSVFRFGAIDDRAFDEALEAVSVLIDRSRDANPARLVVVATSAIRSASNGFELVREIERRHRVSVRIVGPSEEARLAYVGQSLSSFVAHRRVVVVDMGGGSVEVAVGQGARCELTESLPLGAVRVRATCPDASLDREGHVVLAERLRADLDRTCATVRSLRPEVLVFGSGSARAARRLAMRDSQQPGKTGPLSEEALRRSVERHAGLPEGALVALGVEPRRAPTVLIATSLMAELLRLCGPIPAYVSNRGLRDGVALETHRELTRGRRAATAMLWG
jgi:exopolyphosphatase / guanosine-5'-triphosphate,3'-diphosphate pyrophosphatase